MIKINANKLHTFGILIPEEVYIRTIQDFREGELSETNKENLKVWYSYKAYLKEKFEQNGILAQNIIIDNLPNSEIIEIPNNESIVNFETFGKLFEFYNLKYVSVLKEKLNLTDEDISICQ